jgi:hypothetical protein
MNRKARRLRFVLALFLLLLVCGCMVSEQIGEPVGHGRNRRPGDDVAVHFDTQFNRIILFGRSAVLVCLALWIFSAFGKSPGAVLVGVAVMGVAAWLFFKDYPTLTHYRVEVSQSGLYLNVPPDLDTEIPWNAIEELELEGFAYGSARADMTPGSSATIELPAWETMDITLSDGTKHRIVLVELSVEHREIFAQALVRRAGLVEIK